MANVVTFVRRVTLFFQKNINATQENMTLMKETFSGAQVGPAFRADDYELPKYVEGLPWVVMLKKQDIPILIQFAGNKMDVVSQVNLDAEDLEVIVVQKLRDTAFMAIDTLCINNVVRMAYAPTIGIDDSPAIDEYFNQKIQLPIIENIGVSDISLKINSPVKFELDGKEVDTNRSIKISTGLKKENNSQDEIKCVIVELDINTKGENNEFGKDDITEFIKKALSMRQPLIQSIL